MIRTFDVLRPFRLRSAVAGNASIIQRAISILRRFGTDAHVYLPGVGLLNGLQAANYIDSAGTQNGAVDQPVGLVLDAGGGLGVELVVNGDFSNGATGWAAGSGSVLSSAAGVITVSLVGGDTYGNANQLINLVVGKTYQYTAKVVSQSVGSASSGISTTATGAIDVYAASGGVGDKSAFFTATTTTAYIQLQAVSGANAVTEFSKVSVREVTGIHGQQATTASKPILRRGAVAISQNSRDLSSDGIWVRQGTATKTGSSQVNLPAVSDKVLQSVTRAVSAGEVLTFAIELSGSGTTSVELYRNDGGLSEGAFLDVVLTPTPVLYVVTHTFAAAHTAVRLSVFRADAGKATSVNVSAAALFQGTYTAAQIQALGGIPLTTTAPASTALGPYFWQFDGVNDSLSLGGPLFQMADDHCVVVGFNAESAATGYIFFNGAGDQTRVASPFVNAGPTVVNMWRDAGGSTSLTHPNAIALNQTYVLSGRRLNGFLETRLNGVLTHSTAVPAFGAAVSTAASVGNNSALGSINFKGSIYPAVAIKGAVSDAEQMLLKRFIGQLSGVQI